MSPSASYVEVNTENNERWSTFEEYKPLIALLYLAASDKEIEATEGFTPEGRLDAFIKELALLGRAHNWDSTRINPQTGEEEEYDDLEGDKPS